MTRRRKWVRRALAGLVVAVGLWLFAALLVADQLTGRSRPPYPEPPPAVPWGTLRPLRLSTADGHDLGAWFVPGRPDRPPVVLVHGNGGSRSSCLPEAELLATAGHPVLLLTARAHGDSSGDRNDFGLGARHDVVAAVAWLDAELPGRPVVVWGQSLGAAAALFAAPDLGPRAAGYVLECPYRDLRTAVRNRTRVYLPPVVDWVAYAGLTAAAPLVLPDVDAISPVEAAGRFPPGVPALVLAGGADRRAIPDDVRAIADRIGPGARLVVFDGDHLALGRADPDGYRATILGFLDTLAGPVP